MDAFADAAPAGPERKINIRWSALAICALTGALGLYIMTRPAGSGQKSAAGNSVTVNADGSTPATQPAQPTQPNQPTQPGTNANKPAPNAPITNANATAPKAALQAHPLPKATRGAEAIVRYTRPDAEGLLLLETGKAPEALAWSEAHKAECSALGVTAAQQVAQLRARALLAQGRFDEAAKCFAALNPSDALFGAELCAAKGNAEAIPDEQLKKVLELRPAQKDQTPLKVYTDFTWGEARAAYETARRLSQSKFQRGDEAARPYFQQAYLSCQLEEPLEKDCFAKLNDLTTNLILNPKRVTSDPKTVIHKVGSGDSLSKIAKKYGVPVAQISRLNKLDPKAALYIGKPLKVMPGPVELLVDRWRLTATLLIDGVFIHQYPVGIGQGENTPAGEFTIKTKLVNPDWWYAGKKIPFGQPENILGTRWMGFDKEEKGGKAAGIGVHGTGIPESVPGRESKGCVRMHNEDVEELYDFIPQGGVVLIGE